LGITPTELVEFCQTAQITELALFGSILRDDFGPDSDIDMLVTFTPDCKLDLMGFVQLEYDLEDWLHREVDLVSKRAVEDDDPIVGLYSGSPDLATNAEDILAAEIQPKSGWTNKP
jgi:hypothetical protein